MHDDTITLFNLHRGRWYPCIIDGVHMEHEAAANLTVNGVNNTSTVLFLIGASDGCIKSRDGIRKYVPPKIFQQEEDPSWCITFTPEKDFILEGEYSGDVVSEDNFDEGFYHEINSTYDGVHMITASEYLKLIPHFEVAAR